MVIASRTGWTEDYIRWWLPLSRGWAYYHAARLLDGEAMRFPGGTTKDGAWLDSVEERLGKIRHQRLAKAKGFPKTRADTT